ncbi:mlo protein [Marchantia polymorpha subsp. ruderalis]|uniref:MLO-like protein n=2 Tax=Marchantia polymorpha TaxID=3197 RepID=A0AAF6B8G6_MARPO|nr:hypothetical protein MARPO_0011s0033 [Marchantia polymorpha]BBN08300.1 hypothetical protein Mp_4g10460 [Marchantia polymorpha subsp. ruderalis]|eukprot:PTQ46336.1 hypothetical protein MARPO_0011s0033 [Marchantia polymorpha]
MTEGGLDQMLVPNESYALEHTPTWAVGLVCVVFIALSLLMQRGLQKLGNWLVKRHQKPLNEALEKMKEELMLLGFISLLLTAAQNPISRLCMPDSWADHMLPCHFDQSTEAMTGNGGFNESPGPERPPEFNTPLSSDPAEQVPIPHHIRTLLVDHDSSVSSRMLAREVPPFDMDEYVTHPRRILSGISTHHLCSPGHVPVLSTESLHQLHIFIFVMAVVHVFYSCFTMLFGFTQLRSWKRWEAETCVDNYNYTDEIKKSFNESTFKKMAFTRQSTFVASRTSTAWSTTFTGSWIMSFLRQFGRSVTKSDYLTLRLGFIKNHNAPLKLNFYKYMMRSLEDDLKTVIGISGYLWVFVIFFMILNVHGWYAYFWMSFIPVVINMVIGTKLQHIITQLAMETAHSHGIIGDLVKPRDELFWFNNPHVLLYLIHFVLFQNAFELAFCIWLVTTFGFNSCYFNKHGFIITRVIVGILAQVLCSYSTLPLYALVSQMGSHYKKAIFDIPVSNAIQGWRSKAKETRRKLRQENHKSEHIIEKGFEHIHLHLHHGNSDASSHHGSRLEIDTTDHDDHSIHHSILHGHKFHLHPDTPKTPKTPRTPKMPKSKSDVPVTDPGAEPDSAVEQATSDPEKGEEVKDDTFDVPVPVVLKKNLSFKLPREESIVERDGPVTAPWPVNIVDRMARLPSRKIKSYTIEVKSGETLHPSMVEPPNSLPPTPRPAAAAMPGSSLSVPATPSASTSGEDKVRVQAHALPVQSDREIENITTTASISEEQESAHGKGLVAPTLGP